MEAEACYEQIFRIKKKKKSKSGKKFQNREYFFKIRSKSDFFFKARKIFFKSEKTFPNGDSFF